MIIVIAVLLRIVEDLDLWMVYAKSSKSLPCWQLSSPYSLPCGPERADCSYLSGARYKTLMFCSIVGQINNAVADCLQGGLCPS